MVNPRILAVSTAHPPERFTQDEILAFAGYGDERRRGFFLNGQIEGRYLAIDRETFHTDESIDALQERFRRASVELGARALRDALERAGRVPGDLDFLATTTCTGRLCPSLDAHLIRALELPSGIQRVHVGDTGCSSAIVALQQAWNRLRALPGGLAAVVASEISSAAYFMDEDLETAVANAIFSDGAAAVILGSEGPGPELVAHRTLFRPEHLECMGFTFPGGYQRILLSKDVRHIAVEMMGELIATILAENGLARKDVRHWVIHSAGRSVLDRARDRLGLSEEQLGPARKVLREYGNMSSATVLFVLREILDRGGAEEGDWGVMVALGPGFAAEGALLRW